MSDFAWFRLLVRGIGILLLGLSVPMFLWGVGSAFTDQLRDASSSSSRDALMTFLYRVPYLVGYGAQAAFGLYLLFGGQRLVELAIKGVRGRCGVCGYDLAAVTAPVCPECGTPIHRPPSPGEQAAKT
jgi:hypothetical protein